MDNSAHTPPFGPADILMPCGCDLTLWSVVACDQYTSQPEYWQRVEQAVGAAPSALRLILPESRLEGPEVELDILEIRQTMAKYLRNRQFARYPDSLFYIRRTLDSGKVRQGLLGMVDLEDYDYEMGATSLVRATEGTVLSRIPPRVAVRKHAPIELPHVMLLTDDPQATLIEPLADQTGEMEPVYDFPLMERGGHIQGWSLTRAQKEQVRRRLEALADPAAFGRRYGADNLPVLLFAVGDGNHSLATAKECYERAKRAVPPDQWAALPARYALCELVNLHDPSLDFEPIHRVVFDVDPEGLLAALCAAHPGTQYGQGAGQVLHFAHGQTKGVLTISNPTAQLPVGTLQRFLDEYCTTHPQVRVDYIHGADVAEELARQSGAIAFLLPVMDKKELFPTVVHDGALPRKTFSMGEAHDKRFYLEAREIKG